MSKKLLMTASVWQHIANFHLPYLRDFKRLGWETHVGCASVSIDEPSIDKAIDLPFEKRFLSVRNFRTACKLRNLVKEEKYDLIITHTTLAAFFTRLAVKGLKNRPPLVNVMHGYLFDDMSSPLRRTILLGAERIMAPETDLLLTMNQWDYECAQKYRLGKRIEKIPGMGVDFSRLHGATKEDGLHLRSELGIPEDAFVLIYPAEFSKRKSQHMLIEAMQDLPETIRLVLCGTGELLEPCRKLAEKLKVHDRVLFPGQVDNIAVWYRMADAIAASSRSEGLPFNIMEAMYLGLPVIASDVKGHADLIEDGVNGLLYPYGCVEKFTDFVRQLMQDSGLREKYISNNQSAADRFKLQSVLLGIMGNYLSVFN